MHGRFRAKIPQYPFSVAGRADPALASRFVANFQNRELDRGVDGHVVPQFRVNARRCGLEDAVAEPVADHMGHRLAGGQGRGRPDAAGLFVAQVQRLSARIAHRVVMPGREAEFVRVLAPGVGNAAFRDHRSELRIRQHVYPRRRRYLPGCEGNDVFAPVAGEAAQPVAEDQLPKRGRGVVSAVGPIVSARHKLGSTRLRKATMVKLFRKRSAAIGDDGACDRLQQNAVLARYLLRRPYEDAARPIDHARLDARGDQSHDLFLQSLPVTGVIFVPDHQVHRQPLQAPVRMGLYQLAHEIDIGRVTDLQQYDRQVSGNGVTPQPGLPAAILDEHGRVGAQRGVGIDDGAGEACIKLRIGLGGIELAQHHLAVRPAQIEDAVREMPVLVFLDQAQRHLAGFADTRHDIDGDRLFRIECERIADGDDRIQHRALGAGERRRLAHRQRSGAASGAADEAQAVRLVGYFADVRPVRRHQVKHPGRALVHGAGPARAQNGAARAHDLGLHEKIAEGGMQRVRGRRRDHHFGVTGDVDLPALARSIGDADPAQLDVILR